MSVLDALWIDLIMMEFMHVYIHDMHVSTYMYIYVHIHAMHILFACICTYIYVDTCMRACMYVCFVNFLLTLSFVMIDDRYILIRPSTCMFIHECTYQLNDSIHTS